MTRKQASRITCRVLTLIVLALVLLSALEPICSVLATTLVLTGMMAGICLVAASLIFIFKVCARRFLNGTKQGAF